MDEKIVFIKFFFLQIFENNSGLLLIKIKLLFSLKRFSVDIIEIYYLLVQPEENSIKEFKESMILSL
jgi:hypothetical protein